MMPPVVVGCACISSAVEVLWLSAAHYTNVTLTGKALCNEIWNYLCAFSQRVASASLVVSTRPSPRGIARVHRTDFREILYSVFFTKICRRILILIKPGKNNSRFV